MRLTLFGFVYWVENTEILHFPIGRHLPLRVLLRRAADAGVLIVHILKVIATNMSAVVHLTSILLALLISDVAHAAALPNGHAKISSEAWPPLYWGPPPPAQSWGQPAVPNWPPSEGWRAPSPKSLNPIIFQNPNTVKNMEGNVPPENVLPENVPPENVPPENVLPENVPPKNVPPETVPTEKVPPENPETQDQGAKPRSFHINFQAPMSNPEDGSTGQDYSQSQGSGHFHMESKIESPFEDSSKHGSFYPSKKHQDSSKHGFHFSLSIPLPTTTAAPKAPASVFNAGLSNTGTSHTRFYNYPYYMPDVNKPVYQKPSGTKVVSQRPPESKLVSFFSGLLDHKGQSNQNAQTSTRTQQNPVFFKPVGHNHPSTQSLSGSHHLDFGHHQTPTNYWRGQRHLSSADPGSGVQHPAQYPAQNVHYSHTWFPITSSDSADVRKSVLQYAKYVNGQLMIPLEKCPGFENFAALLQNYYQGQVHHHGHTPPSGPVQTKPHYTNMFLNMEGYTPNPTQGTNVQHSGAYQKTPFRWWQDSKNVKTDQPSVHFFNPQSYTSYVHKEPNSQQSVVKPGQTNYMVQHGTNVGYDQQPDQQGQNHFEYVQHSGHSY
ncbi:uncharacterized protein LOC129409458 [Boleophthalmus pectinirostris]|uniref:uncharacterized protein LOC129409458 n=1 Tax=Boleophthalmus pectinirostris TaxID=150288 RepID=UPI00242F6267|nr:uncharacterized protein LOC129409458 [Boleophthalmus pectinirostris]